MEHPLVSVICLCYNQQRFVRESIASVFDQTYPNVELIIVDDASTDASVATIRDCIAGRRGVTFIPLEKNIGNCRAFNRGLREARGSFIIDLAADDVLLPERVAKGVEALRDSACGVNFSDCAYIAPDGRPMGKHSDRFPHHTVPQGDVYLEVIRRFFICSPTVMLKRDVMDTLGGYDANLLYEDFDLWVRSSRTYRYCYTPEVLVKKRFVKQSLSQRQFAVMNPYQRSTFKVCEKIMWLNRTETERDALGRRIRYEIRVSLRQLNLVVALKFLKLLWRNSKLRY